MKQKALIIVFIMYLSFFLFGSILKADEQFSEMENRYLAKKPAFTIKNLIEGKFTKGIEDYCSDHLIMKDNFVKIKNESEEILHKIRYNGVYITKDGRYIQEFLENTKRIEDNITFINNFAEMFGEQVTIQFLLAPTAAGVYQEALPKAALFDDQAETAERVAQLLNKRIEFINPFPALAENKTEAIYFKTDHHWTMQGAFLAYQELDKANQKKSLKDYNVKKAEELFLGSLYSKAPKYFIQGDEFIYYEKEQNKFSGFYETDAKREDSIFDYDKLNVKDKYTFFLGGNHALIKIVNEAENTAQDKILVIKDSYANSLIPFLAEDYEEVHLIDLRYYHNSVKEYMMGEKIKKILFVHNIDFLNSDKNFMWLK